jgi:hypothetical protein
MHLTRKNLLRIAKETALKSALSDPGLLAAYLSGSVRTENPYLGNATDVDIVFVHTVEPKVRREIIPLTPEIHLDIIHNPRSFYDKPRELRIHPWLGPELYDPLPLHDPQHFFEFIQAGVRDRYDEPANVQLRSRQLAENARQAWMNLHPGQSLGAGQVLGYLKSISLAAQAIALLTGDLLAERRFVLQFPERARAVGQPGLTGGLLGLLGAERVEAAALSAFLPEWEKAFLEATGIPAVNKRIAIARLGYYKLAFESLLESETPQAILWPLLLTWTYSVSVLPPARDAGWRSACATLGLEQASFGERMDALDHFLDAVEAILENFSLSQGL